MNADSPTIFEFAQTTIRLRSDLNFRREDSWGKLSYVLEDPRSKKFYQLGELEYEFISKLDGSTTVGSILRESASRDGEQAISEDEAKSILQWLASRNLLVSEETLATPVKRGNFVLLVGKLLGFRLPISPFTILVDRLAPKLSHLFSPLGVTLWTAALFFGAVSIAGGWGAFANETREIIDPQQWLSMALVWGVLKVWHEICHAAAAYRYGVKAHSAGIAFYLFAPVAYVDLSSTWSVGSRWSRIVVSAAGMFGEFLVAAIAAIAWRISDNVWIDYWCCQIIVMASITTLAFNINPLMRMDGYYILSDMLGVPNLDQRSQAAYWRGIEKLLGFPSGHSRESHEGLFAIFGLMASLWRSCVAIALVIALSIYFHGAGIVIAWLAIVVWFAFPILGRIYQHAKSVASNNAVQRQVAIRLVAIATTAFTTWNYILWPGNELVPCYVDHAADSVVRAASDGYLIEFLKGEGKEVQIGDAIARLENPILQSERTIIQAEIEQSKIRGRCHHQAGKLSLVQEENELCKGLEAKLREKETQLGDLIIRARASGRIHFGDTPSMLGRYFKKGESIGIVDNPDSYEIKILVSQSQERFVRPQVGKTVEVALLGQSLLHDAGTLMTMEQHASDQIRNPSMLANAGGPIAVRPSSKPSTESNPANAWVLVSPHFEGRIVPRREAKLFCGQRGWVSVRHTDQTVGQHLLDKLERWYRNQLNDQSTGDTIASIVSQ